MCDFYECFYAQEGPGAMVYLPDAENKDESMFYLTVPHMISALEDMLQKEMEGPADVLRQAIARGEALNPLKEALFIIQDKEKMSLVQYNKEKSVVGPIIA
jgi:hypothetical protein